MAYFACTEDRAWPIADVLYAGWAGLFGIAVMLAGTSNASEWGPEDGLGLIAISGLSGIAVKKGFEKVSACRRAKLEEAQRNRTFVPPSGGRAGSGGGVPHWGLDSQRSNSAWLSPSATCSTRLDRGTGRE